MTSLNQGNRQPFKMPGLRGLIWPIVIFLVLTTVAGIYRSFQGGIESKMAVDQLKDNVYDYGVGHMFATSNTVGTITAIAWWILIVSLLIWLGRLGKAVYDHEHAGN